MRISLISRLSIILMAIPVVFSCNKSDPSTDIPEPEEPIVYRDMPDVAGLVSKAGVVASVAAENTITLARGVQETDMTLTLTSGFKENIFIISADQARDSIFARVAMPGNSTIIPSGQWPRHSLSRMASSLDGDGGDVIAMVNADFWNTSTYIPRGPVHMDGFVMKSSFEAAYNKQGISYIACSDKDEMSIDYSASYSNDAVKAPNLSGSGLMLTWDGKQVDNSSWPADDRHPRTALGYSSDGFLYFFCVDGRQEGVSEGMTYDEMGSIFAALGCERAVNLDGGGSTQLLVRNPSSGKFEIRNKPSDGEERGVVNAWAIMRL